MLGIDSSTQSTKALLVDADDGRVVDARTAPHPPGTEVDPRAWLGAVDDATRGLLERADAVSVAGQQHGMVALDADGEPVRDALLWNDTRSAGAAHDLIAEMGGPQACADAVGSVLVASFTVTKLRWLRDHEPENAARVARVLLPHDYVSLHLGADGTEPFTDRGDASGTGYFATADGAWRPDLLERALGRSADLPRLVAPGQAAGTTRTGAMIAGGTGDNMGAALGMALRPGDVLVSVGTSGVASAVSTVPVADGTGVVTGFADASGGFLPMVTTMNAAGILDLQAQWLGVDHDGLADLALGVHARRGRRHPAALLRRRAHPQPSRRRRHLDRADAPHDPRRPGAGGVRGAALLARRRRRPARGRHRRAAAPPADGRRRHQEPRTAGAGPGDPRRVRDAAAVG